MGNLRVIAVAVLITLIYILAINFISTIDFSVAQQIIDGETSLDSGIINIGVGDSVSYSITRPRWYGTIYEDQNNAKLYLFEIIPLPMKNYVYVHFIFLIGIGSFLYFKLKKRKVNKGEIYEYERGWQDEYEYLG
jgi:hypothetical protein